MKNVSWHSPVALMSPEILDSLDSEESKHDLAVDAYHRRPRRPSKEELLSGIQTLRPSFVSLPQPRNGYSPPQVTVRYPNYGSVSAIDDLSPASSHNMKLSTLTTFMNLVSQLMGVGFLALPFAFASVGWIAVPICLVLGAVQATTACLLASCQKMTNSGHYQDIAEAAFGARGRNVCNVFFSLAIFLDLVVFLRLFAVTVTVVCTVPTSDFSWTDYSVPSVLMFAAVSCLVPSGKWVNLVSALATLVLIMLLLSDLMIKASDVIMDQAPAYDFFKGFPSLVRTFCLFSYCFAGHSAVPTLVSNMADGRHAKTVIVSSFVLATVAYIAIGSLGLIISAPLGAFDDQFLYVFLEANGVWGWDMAVRGLSMIVLMAKFFSATQPLVYGAVDFGWPHILSSWNFFTQSQEQQEVLIPAYDEVLGLLEVKRRVKFCVKMCVRFALPFLVLSVARSGPLESLVVLFATAGAASTTISVVLPCVFALELLDDTLSATAKVCYRVLTGVIISAAILCAIWYLADAVAE